MLKGLFYRRMSENNQFPREVYIRFEINSKESILARITNLCQEGIQFLLPRGKVILVPDERILLILNSPEHGEFKIASDVCYFCNTTDQEDRQQVFYGAKFFELSVSIWEVILDFCGDQFPEVTFLAPVDIGQTSEKSTTRQIFTAKPAIKPNESTTRTGPRSKNPIDPLIPLPSPGPNEVASVIPDIVAGLPQASQKEQPVGQRAAKLDTSELSLPTKKNFPQLQSRTATQTHPTEAQRSNASQPAIHGNAPEMPLQSENNSIPTATSAPTETKKAVKTKPVAISEPHPATTADPGDKPNPSSIQVLAASLATPLVPHTQPKAQSLSQEMIDRLIEKLQAEEYEAQLEVNPPQAPNPVPEHFRVATSELNKNPYQNAPDPTITNPVEPTAPRASAVPFTFPNNNAGLTFGSDNLQFDKFKQPEPETDAPERSAATNHTDTAPFDPFASFNFKSGNGSNPEANPSEEGPAAEPIAPADTAAFVPFAPFTFPPDSTEPLDPGNFDNTPDENQSSVHKKPHTESQKAPASSISGQRETSLGDLMSNLDSAIYQNGTSVSAKTPIAADTISATQATHKATTNISLEELQKIEIPYSGKLSSNTGGTGSMKKISETKSRAEKKTAASLKTAAIGPTIIPNASGISLDQKAIDKLVDSLLQDMAVDEAAAPAGQSVPTKPVPPLSNGSALKNEAEFKAGHLPAENPLHLSGTNLKGLNIGGIDPTSTRVMDQKSIDMIVKTLTEAESGTSTPAGPEADLTVMRDTIPTKPFTPLETKRILDQKAIDQVVQALTQNTSAKNSAGTGRVKPSETREPSRNIVSSLAAVSATLQLENGKVLRASVEQVYVGGAIVILEQEIPLNSALKLNLSGKGIHITDVIGSCTNCEATAPGQDGFLAEIFFKNMSNTHMEQFRALISQLNPHHKG
jgi:hypothetical protein